MIKKQIRYVNSNLWHDFKINTIFDETKLASIHIS
jgi:hypothetical protein